jgi:hypothetical protein
MVHNSDRDKVGEFFEMLRPRNAVWITPVIAATIALVTAEGDTVKERLEHRVGQLGPVIGYAAHTARDVIGNAAQGVQAGFLNGLDAATRYAQDANAPHLEADIEALRTATVGTVRVAVLPNEGIDAVLGSFGYTLTDLNKPEWRAYFQEVNGLTGTGLQSGESYDVPILEGKLVNKLEPDRTYVPVHGPDNSVIGWAEYAGTSNQR